MRNIATMTEESLRGMRKVDVQDHLNTLLAERDKLAEDGLGLEPKQRKAICEKIRADLLSLWKCYGDIDATRHPNIVVAQLAKLQGAEQRMKDELVRFASRVESKKVLDEQLTLCNAAIEVMNEDPLQS